jgi:MYXO-CTERM domain-containing protein
LPATVYFDDVFLPEPELLTSAAAALVVLAALARWRHESR